MLYTLKRNGGSLITVLILQDRGEIGYGCVVHFIAASVSIVILLSMQIVPVVRFLVDIPGLRHFLEQNDPHLFVRLGMHDYNNSLAIIRVESLYQLVLLLGQKLYELGVVHAGLAYGRTLVH